MAPKKLFHLKTANIVVWPKFALSIIDIRKKFTSKQSSFANIGSMAIRTGHTAKSTQENIRTGLLMD
jgi:hypothetical protein